MFFLVVKIMCIQNIFSDHVRHNYFLIKFADRKHPPSFKLNGCSLILNQIIIVFVCHYREEPLKEAVHDKVVCEFPFLIHVPRDIPHKEICYTCQWCGTQDPRVMVIVTTTYTLLYSIVQTFILILLQKHLKNLKLRK